MLQCFVTILHSTVFGNVERFITMFCGMIRGKMSDLFQNHEALMCGY